GDSGNHDFGNHGARERDGHTGVHVSGASTRGNRIAGCAQRYLLSRSTFAMSAQRETAGTFVHPARSITRSHLCEGLRASARSTILRSAGTDGGRFAVPQRLGGRGTSREHFREGDPFLSAVPVLCIADSGLLSHARPTDRAAQELRFKGIADSVVKNSRTENGGYHEQGSARFAAGCHAWRH